MQRFFLEGGIARPVGRSCFHSSCSKRKPLGAAEKAARGGSLPHWRDVWDCDTALSALQPVVSSGWLLSCPHDLLTFPWPANAAPFQGSSFGFSWLCPSCINWCSCSEQIREERGHQGCVLSLLLSCPRCPQQGCGGHEESWYRQVQGCCGCAALWFHFLYIQVLSASLRWASPSKEGAAGGSVPLLSRKSLLYTVTGL